MGAEPFPVPPNLPRFVTCPVRCPFLFRTIVKRHAMTGSRLGRYTETGQPPGFSIDRKKKIVGS
ncbi:MAG: hypothetical protein WCH85_08840 [Methanomicrobiales archaeon]